MFVTIAFAGASDRDTVLRLTPETTLRQLRERLAAEAGMLPAERFRFGNAGLDPSIEGEVTVAEAIDKDRTITVRPAPRAQAPAKPAAQPRPVPRVTAPEARPGEALWGLRNEADAPDLLPQWQTRMAAANVRDPDEFTALPLETIAALFSARRLDRGLRFGPKANDHLFGARSPRSPVIYRHPQRPPHSGGVPYTASWNISATASRVLHELHTRSIHNANAGGGVNGFALAARFRDDLERLRRSEVTQIHLVEEMIVPRVVLMLDPDTDLEGSPELIEAVDAALAVRGGRQRQYAALHERVFDGFGYFFPCETLLGGSRMRTLSTVSESLQEQEQLLSGFGFGAAAQDVPTSYGPASGDIGFARSDSRLSRHRHIVQLREQRVRAIGGHAALGMADEHQLQWMASLDAVARWEAIGHRRMVPILRFLPPKQRNQCVGVIEQFARSRITGDFTVLDMAAYVTPLNRDLLDELM
ncbi:hypothetical protein K4L06_10410 [Lysobacter sp. BMK333-48F3]|uniref:hypothetical protein n=1 Tax=Lysobacter sp. BMK333-48F3 TaxID=2867962 RepID=UPI001C8B73D5|nr:hypothetical protein [Lysobacter sp. BMK333-48F3]MBX9401724.1 hypothetical protein [Lysobacter sp. BMK333-48F3]